MIKKALAIDLSSIKYHEVEYLHFGTVNFCCIERKKQDKLNNVEFSLYRHLWFWLTNIF